MSRFSGDSRKDAVNKARVAAIQAKYEDVQREKRQIQESLKNVNNEKIDTKNHIRFDSDSEESNYGDTSITFNSKNVIKDKKVVKGDKILGFNSDDDSELEIKVKEQFEGKDGENLMKVQAKIGSDSRFQLDNRFKSEESTSSSSSSSDDSSNEDKKGKEEVDKNLSILNDIMGKSSKNIVNQKKKSVKFVDQSTIRYDPTTDKSKKLEIVQTKKEKKKKEKGKEKTTAKEPVAIPGKFHEASYSNLKSTFSKKKIDETETTKKLNSNTEKPFSFTAMFAEDNPEMDLNDNEESVKTMSSIPVDINDHKLFKDLSNNELLEMESTSSDTDEEDENMEVQNQDSNLRDSQNENDITSKPFFVTSENDSRLFEGVKSFILNKSKEEIFQDWLAVRDILTEDYKKKHKNAKRKHKSYSTNL